MGCHCSLFRGLAIERWVAGLGAGKQVGRWGQGEDQGSSSSSRVGGWHRKMKEVTFCWLADEWRAGGWYGAGMGWGLVWRWCWDGAELGWGWDGLCRVVVDQLSSQWGWGGLLSLWESW